MTTAITSRRQSRDSALDHSLAMRLAATEYTRVADLLERLSPQTWSSPTVCSGWDVRAVAGHVLGMVQIAASTGEMVRQQRTAAKLAGRRASADGNLDALTALQVEKNRHLTTEELVQAIRRSGPKAVRGRRRIPAVVRNHATVSAAGAGLVEKWRVGYLTDVILTRDPWMHRSDIAVATGAQLDLSADHDGVIVNDVVTEWAARHGQPFDLELTGVAGGNWSTGRGGERIELDAVEFCRILSEGGEGPGLLSVRVPF